MYAAIIGNWETVNYLSIRGILLDVEDKEGKTLLFRAVAGEQYELASKLLRRGANVNA